MTDKPVTQSTLTTLMAALGKRLGVGLVEAVTPLRDRVKTLEARLEALERDVQQREYKGVYHETTPYWKGNSVTFKGSLWIATRDTADVPATSDAWILAVKRGRDR